LCGNIPLKPTETVYTAMQCRVQWIRPGSAILRRRFNNEKRERLERDSVLRKLLLWVERTSESSPVGRLAFRRPATRQAQRARDSATKGGSMRLHARSRVRWSGPPDGVTSVCSISNSGCVGNREPPGHVPCRLRSDSTQRMGIF